MTTALIITLYNTESSVLSEKYTISRALFSAIEQKQNGLDSPVIDTSDEDMDSNHISMNNSKLNVFDDVKDDDVV